MGEDKMKNKTIKIFGIGAIVLFLIIAVTPAMSSFTTPTIVKIEIINEKTEVTKPVSCLGSLLLLYFIDKDYEGKRGLNNDGRIGWKQY
jgi:hypothetical protein